MQLNKQLLADLPAAQPTNPALKLPPLKGMGTSFVSQAQDKDWDMPRRRRALGAAQRKLNYQNAMRRWKKSGGLFGLYRGPRPQAPAAPPPELAPYVKGVLAWGLAKLFDESKVRRDEDGKFAPKGDAAPRSRLTGLAPRERSVASIYSRGPQWEPGEGKTYDWSRSVRPTKDMPFATRQAYAAYRSKLDRSPPPPPATDAAAWAEMPEPPQLPTAGGTRFKMVVQRPQVPSTMSQDQYIELARWAAQRTRDERDEHIKRSIGRKDPGGHKHKMLLPADANPKDPDIRFAFNLARNIAMHNVGLFYYDYRMTPDTIQAMQPYRAFIKHTARKLDNMLRSEKPGVWAQFRREFGQEFKDGRTYKFDTAGQVAGEKKKFFLRHEPAVKAALNWGLAKAFGNPDLTQAEIEQRRNAARARWARVAGRADARDDAALKAPKAIRAFEPPGAGWISKRERSFDPAETEAMRHELSAVRRDIGDAELQRDALTLAELDKTSNRRAKWIAGGKDPKKKPRYVKPEKVIELQSRIKDLKAREDELFWQLRPQDIERDHGLLWIQKNPPQHSGWDIVRARNVRRDDLRMYEKEPQYREAERAHITRVKAVKEDRRKSTIQRLFSAPEAPPQQPKMSPAATPIAVRVTPKMRISGKAGAVAAGVIGGAALGYGLSRWRQRTA